MIISSTNSQVSAESALAQRQAALAKKQAEVPAPQAAQPTSELVDLQLLNNNSSAASANGVSNSPDLQSTDSAQSLLSQTVSLFGSQSQQALNAHAGLTADRVLQLLAD